MTIRPARQEDEDALYDICLKTGEFGNDASHLYDDPKAPGYLWAAPYLALEPELSFVLESDGKVSGYIVGALDSDSFERAYLERWLPPLQRRLPDPGGDPSAWTPTERIYHEIHHPQEEHRPELGPYPSHLHINLLPEAQGRGNGRRLITTFLAALRERGSPGVHLGVDERNERARGFYRKMGFEVLGKGGTMVLKL